MKLEYTLTLDDYKAAWRLHRRQKVLRWLIPYVWPALFLSSFAGMIYLSDGRHPLLASQLSGLSAGFLVIAIGSPLVRMINIRRSYRMHFPIGQTNKRSVLEIDDEKIVRELVDVNQIKVPWSAVHGFAEDQRISIIYTNKYSFLMIPTSAMSPAQRAELNDLVARHVTPRKP